MRGVYLSRESVIKPLNEGHHGALATPTGTHQGQRLATLDVERKPVQNWYVQSGGVGEFHVLEFNRALKRVQNLSLLTVDVNGRCLQVEKVSTRIKQCQLVLTGINVPMCMSTQGAYIYKV